MSYLELFKSLSIGGVRLKNRLAMAPMGTAACDHDGLLNQTHVNYYAARAKGGLGLIILEGQNITCKTDPVIANQVMNDSEAQMVRWHRVIRAVHAYGAKAAMQLCDGHGRVSGFEKGGPVPVSASEVPALFDENVLCRALTVEEIAELVEKFARCAERAVRAGADIIEVNAHQGYLIDQFMTPLWNKRTDQYGGNFENRMRYVTEIYDAVRAAIGPDVPLGIRISMCHDFEGGRTLEESKELCKYFEDIGFDFIDANYGSEQSPVHQVPSVYMQDACNIAASKAAKEAVNIPVFNAGKHTPETAREAVEKGYADVVLLGRAVIADPDLPLKLMEDREDDVRPCLACNQGCLGLLYRGLPVSCAVNAQACAEEEFAITKTDSPKEVIVVGGGPGGMEAARVAALKGHHVRLFEKSDGLGGQFRAAAAPPFKNRLKSFLDWQERQLAKYDVEVFLNAEVKADSSELAEADEIIIAVGAHQKKLPIPGIDLPNVINALEAHLDPDLVLGDIVVVAGGGQNGCELALELAMAGKMVTIVEMLDELLTREIVLQNRKRLLQQLEEHGVKQLTGTKVVEFVADGVIAEGPAGRQKLRASTTVFAYGAIPEEECRDEILDKYPAARVVGDCDDVGRILEAIQDGFFAGWSIE